MNIEIEVTRQHTLLDKDPRKSVWSLAPSESGSGPRWVEYRGVRYPEHRVRLTGESLRAIADKAQGLRESCPLKPSYLGGASAITCTLHGVWRETPGPGFIVVLSMNVVPSSEDLPPLGPGLLEDLHAWLGIQ